MDNTNEVSTESKIEQLEKRLSTLEERFERMRRNLKIIHYYDLADPKIDKEQLRFRAFLAHFT